MDIKDLLQSAKDLSNYQFEQKLNKLVRDNYRYRNLNAASRKIIMDLMKKFKPYLRKGISISYSQRQREIYKLNQNRVKLGLTKEDIRDIKKFLSGLA